MCCSTLEWDRGAVSDLKAREPPRRRHAQMHGCSWPDWRLAGEVQVGPAHRPTSRPSRPCGAVVLVQTTSIALLACRLCLPDGGSASDERSHSVGCHGAVVRAGPRQSPALAPVGPASAEWSLAPAGTRAGQCDDAAAHFLCGGRPGRERSLGRPGRLLRALAGAPQARAEARSTTLREPEAWRCPVPPLCWLSCCACCAPTASWCWTSHTRCAPPADRPRAGEERERAQGAASSRHSSCSLCAHGSGAQSHGPSFARRMRPGARLCAARCCWPASWAARPAWRL